MIGMAFQGRGKAKLKHFWQKQGSHVQGQETYLRSTQKSVNMYLLGIHYMS